MPNLFWRLGGVALLAITASFPFVSHAYEERTTHAALTDEIVDFYNLIHPEDQISSEQKEWIIQGSIEEDADPRWLNHFYDPVYKVGWSGEKAGHFSASVVQAVSKTGFSTTDSLPSPEWAVNYNAQQKFAAYGGNHSWKAALDRYAEGDERSAYISLGHALHLLEDAGTPDHTRNDSHGHIGGDEGSPYEKYADRWTRATIGGLQIPESLQKNGLNAREFRSVDEAIRSLAAYSNKHFFSRDTINDPKYSDPKIVREDEYFGYGLDEFGKEFPIVFIDRKIAQDRSIFREYTLQELSEDVPILNSYFTHLSRQIVLHGAGAVKLFKDQARDAKVNSEFPEHLVGVRRGFLDALHIPTFSLFATAKSVKAYFSSQLATLVKVFGYWFGEDEEEVAEEFDFSGTAADLAAQIDLQNRLEASPDPITPKVKGVFRIEPDEDQAFSAQAVGAPELQTPPAEAIPKKPEPEPYTPPSYGGDGPRVQNVVLENETSSSSGNTAPAAAISNLRIAFVSSTMQIQITWDAAASSTYRIYDAAPSLIFESSSSLAYATSVLEVAREYSFLFELEDPSGTTSTSISITPSSPFTSLYFYRDTRFNSTGKYVLDFTHGNTPFIPVAHSGSSYQGIVFYLNRSPDTGVLNLLSSDNFLPASTTDVLGLYYGGCGTALSPNSVLHIAYDAASCGAGVGLRSRSLVFPMEDNRFVLPTTIDLATALTSSSYITAAFYNASPDGMTLIATDPTLRYLQPELPSGLAPAPPPSITLTLDDLNLKLNVNWASSTDPDSSDGGVRYEFAYSTSSLSSSTWTSKGFSLDANISLEYPNTYVIGVRAVDEFGNISEPIVRTWNFPPDYPVPPAQLIHNTVLGPAAGGGSGQRFHIAATTTIDGAHAWLGPSGANTMALICTAVSCNEANGEVVATSTITGLPPDTESGQVIFTFPETTLSPGDYYLNPVSFNAFKNFVFGAAGNPYPDGEWSTNPDADMFFRLRTVPSSYATYVVN